MLERATATTVVRAATARPTDTVGPTPTPSATPTPTFPADAIVDVASLNVRLGPNTLHPIVDILTDGTAVALRGRSHDDRWLAVLSPDLQEGWVNAQYLTLRRDLRTVPTMITPTPPPTPTPTAVPADPSQDLVLAPPSVAQGDPVLVRLRSPSAVQVVAGLGDTTVPLFRVDCSDPAAEPQVACDSQAGMLPVPADFPPGQQEVHVTAVDAGGNPTDHIGLLTVHAASFATETISLAEEVSASTSGDVRQAESEILRARVWQLQPGARQWQGMWRPPITMSVSSSFGSLRTYNGGSEDDRHFGLDLRARTGAVIVAPAAGRVMMAEPLVVRGNTVWIDHGWGVQSGYFHLDTLRVAAGDDVAAGDVLGTVGKTGRATGPHLHWEVRIAGVPVQPIEFLLRDVGAVP